jgi:chemotaxis protein histidine kinase CheA
MDTQLTAALERFGDELWELQNLTLRLTVEGGGNRQLRSATLKQLELIRDGLEAAKAPRLKAALSEATAVVGDEEQLAAQADQLFSLIEGLVVASRGEGTGSLDAAVNRFLAACGAEAPSAADTSEDGAVPDQGAERPTDSEVAGSSFDAELSGDSSVSQPPDGSAEGPSAPQLLDAYDELDDEDAQEFCAESREHLAAIERNLVELERSGDPAHVAEVFRAAHSIKGGAQYLGLEATATVAHRIETLLDRIRSGDQEPSGDVIAVLLSALDGLAALIEGASRHQPPALDAQAIVGRLEAAAAGRELAGVPAPDEAAGAAPTEAVEAPRSEPSLATEEPGELAAESPAVPEAKEPAGEVREETLEPSEEAAADGAVPAATGGEDSADAELFIADYRENMASARGLLEHPEVLASDPEQLAVVTRNLHTLKGIAGFVGLAEMERLAQSLEQLLARALRHRSDLPHDIRLATTASLDLIDEVFSQFVEQGAVDVEVEEIVSRVGELAEREGRVIGWRSDDGGAAAGIASSDHPYAALFRELLEASGAGDLGRCAGALGELEEAGSLHGYDSFVREVGGVRSALDDLSSAAVREQLERLARLVPEDLGIASLGASDELDDRPFDELIVSVPGIGPKKAERLREAGLTSCEAVRDAGVAGLLEVRGINVEQARMLLDVCHRGSSGEASTSPLEALRGEILEDDYDLELVRIYLETTRQRVAEAVAAWHNDERELMANVLDDLEAAARYMGYEPLAERFSVTQAVIANDDGGEEVEQVLRQIMTFLDEVRAQRSDAHHAGEHEVPTDESDELEEIFVGSAAVHLHDLARDLLVFVQQMEPDLLSSVQHHLGCLESAATNIARDQAAAVAKGVREQVEAAWLEGDLLTDDAAGRILDGVRELYRQCGLEPPELELTHEAPDPEAEAAEDDIDALFEDLHHGRDAEADLPGGLASRPDVPSAEVRPPEPSAEASLAAEERAAVAGSAASAEESAEAQYQEEVVAAAGEAEHLPAARAEGESSPPAKPPSRTGSGDGGGDGDGPADAGGGVRALLDPQTTLRVDTKKIDDLMNMAAELVVNRSSMMVLGTTVREVITRVIDSGSLSKNEARDLRMVINRFDEASTDLGRVSNQLQEGVMRIRMVPVKVLFSRVPRLVRDLSLREGRNVRVRFHGEETELDKSVIEQLADPLVHLIRNAIGHGLESPEERVAAGKAPEGRLEISARHEGNMVILDVYDDGRGIAFDRVRKRLVDSGLSTEADVDRLGDRELLSAIFLPGFSTSQKVGDVSGRGVGLDVVKQNIESLGGQIEVASQEGVSCRVSIRIPLTMAIMQALLVRVGREVYSIPVSAVIQTVKVTEADISTVERQEVITVRDSVVPLVHLEEVFSYAYHVETRQMNGNGSGREGEEGESEERYVVVLQGESSELGVVVEGVVGGQDIVIKSLEDELVDARGVAGAAILGDGTVTLILDVAEIQKMAVDPEHYEQKRFNARLREFEAFLRTNGSGGGSSLLTN